MTSGSPKRLDSARTGAISLQRKNAFEIIRPFAVFRAKEFVGDVAQPSRESARDCGKIGARVFAGDGAHGIDMLLD
jgi:hypothetical protein